MHMADGWPAQHHDVIEVGKAIGAARAGHVTLRSRAGHRPGRGQGRLHGRGVRHLRGRPQGSGHRYGAGGRDDHLPGGQHVAHAGARPGGRPGVRLWEIERIAKAMRATHCMFAEAPVFKTMYVLESGLLDRRACPGTCTSSSRRRRACPRRANAPCDAKVIQLVERDIPDLGTPRA